MCMKPEVTAYRDQWEEALAQHLLLLLRGSSSQHGCGQVTALLARHYSRCGRWDHRSSRLCWGRRGCWGRGRGPRGAPTPATARLTASTLGPCRAAPHGASLGAPRAQGEGPILHERPTRAETAPAATPTAPAASSPSRSHWHGALWHDHGVHEAVGRASPTSPAAGSWSAVARVEHAWAVHARAHGARACTKPNMRTCQSKQSSKLAQQHLLANTRQESCTIAGMISCDYCHEGRGRAGFSSHLFQRICWLAV